jgi:hypothetical protein
VPAWVFCFCPFSVSSHFYGYCSISISLFRTPSFSLTDWFLSRPNLVFPNLCHKNLIAMIPVDKVLGVTQMLICKTCKSWENELHQHLRFCQQILLPRPRRLRPRDPGQCSLSFSRRARVQTNVQCLRIGPNQLAELILSEKHAGLEVRVWRCQSHNRTICKWPVTNLSRGHLKLLRKPSKGKNGQTFTTTVIFSSKSY